MVLAEVLLALRGEGGGPMRARKCDRCGAFYECAEYGDGIAVDSERHQYRHKEFDLCPECVEGLVEWMRDGGSFNERGTDD